MERQHIFTTKYTLILRERVEKGGDISGYAQEEFPYDKDQLLVLQNHLKPEKLLDKMLVDDSDLSAAIALHSAYKDLTPLEASYGPFWEYLAHADLYKFVKKRWPKAFVEGAGNRQYILDHWFVAGRGLMRHSLSNLWWTVEVTKGDEEDYSLTEFIFDKREDLRLALGISTLFRYRPFTRGILRFLKENQDLTSDYTLPRERFIIQYFNRQGSIKQLACMDEEFFVRTLDGLKPRIQEITSRDDLF